MEKCDIWPNLTKKRAYDKIEYLKGSGEAIDMKFGHKTRIWLLQFVLNL